MNHEELGKIWNFLHVSNGSYGLGRDDATSLLAEYDAVVEQRDSLHDENERLLDALERAGRLLSVCEFSAPEDILDMELIYKLLGRE